MKSILKISCQIKILKLNRSLAHDNRSGYLWRWEFEKCGKLTRQGCKKKRKKERKRGRRIESGRYERKFFFYGGADRCNRLHPRILFLSTLPVFIRIHIWRTPLSRAGRPTSRSAGPCYLKKQSLSHGITFRPDCSTASTVYMCIYVYIPAQLCYARGVPCASIWSSVFV